jgi:hypothetical protein
VSRPPSPDEARRAAEAAADSCEPLPGAGILDEPSLLGSIPPYPLSSVAGPLAKLVNSTTLPAALVAGAGLAAVAGLSGLADLIMPDGSQVRPVLWIPLIAPRGAGKTPAMDAAMSLVRQLDAAEHERYREAVSDWQQMSVKDRGKFPPDPTRRIDDATLEALVRWLNRGDGTGLVESDELSGWLQAIGQYKRTSGDKGRWLAMWSAQPWRYQRVGGDLDICISRPVVSLVGGLQPHLHPLLGDEDSGFRPRWLPHMAPLSPVAWDTRPCEPTEWDAAISKLYEARDRREWTLGGEPLDLWKDASARWKRQARGAESAATSAALDKSDIQCARVALIISESIHPGAGGPVGLDAMTSAVAIVEYAMNCWRALPDQSAFALSIRDEKLAQKVDQLASWLETRAGGQATKREIQQARVAGARTAKDLNILLTEYAAVHPGALLADQPTGARGPSGVIVKAPARHPTRPAESEDVSGETVDGNSFPDRTIGEPAIKTAGRDRQEGRNGTVDTGNSSNGNSSLATVTATDSNGPGDPPAQRPPDPPRPAPASQTPPRAGGVQLSPFADYPDLIRSRTAPRPLPAALQ